ncbi:MAG: hypothetical protein EBV05_13790, partial [Cyanobacteria bacterium WB6_1B_304]|nr:hypothetical protein [Cyanobacteria bacterium WB6_1B_304]
RPVVIVEQKSNKDALTILQQMGMKLVKQVRRAAASVGSCTIWLRLIILLWSIVRVWVLNILLSFRSLRSQDQVSYLEGIPACGALIVLALSLLALQCI